MGMILTDGGLTLLGKALAGKTLTFTRVIIGTGDLGTKNPKTLTDLIARKIALSITNLTTSKTGTAEITAEISNSDITTGFFMKEFGVFATDPDTKKEVLYSYMNKGNEAGYFAGYDGTNPIHYVLTFLTVVDQAQNITAVITENKSYVTPSALDLRITSLFADSATPAGFWTYANNDTQRFRPYTLEQVRRQLIGLADINSLIDRVKTLEDALMQVQLSLNVQEIFPSAKRFMAEDFLVPDTIDLYTAEVTSVIAGDDSIDCKPLDGLLPGSLYTITDGINSEDVVVESINLENGIMRVILTDTIKNTYSLNNCRLLRTTAEVQDGTAYGKAHMETLVWTPATNWKGLASNAGFTAILDSSISHMNSFTFSGAGTINTDGALTLSR